MAGNAFDTRALGEALDDAEGESSATASRPLTIHDVPNDVLVSIFVAIEDPDFVRRTVPLVCKAWNELYCSKDASPPHETLRVVFFKEVERAEEAGQEGSLVQGSRIISWAERRAGSVRNLIITGVEDGSTEDFSFKEMGWLVSVTAPKLNGLVFDFDAYIQSQVAPGELRRRRGGRYVLPDLKPFWKALRVSVAPKGQLRWLQVFGADFSEPDLEPLGRLAGSLETLKLGVFNLLFPRYPSSGDPGIPRSGLGLPRFPELVFDLTELRRLALAHHQNIEAIPAKISSLKKLNELDLSGCRLSSLPKELGELSEVTKLDFSMNMNLGNRPEAEAFPAELGKLKSLRWLDLAACGNPHTVPAFVGKLESLEYLNLTLCELIAVPTFVGELTSLHHFNISWNRNLGGAPEHWAFPAALGKMKSLRHLYLIGCGLRAVPAFVSELESLQFLILSKNEGLGDAPLDKAFPAALGKLTFLRVLDLEGCGLRTVPRFVGELKSLESLYLGGNDLSSLPKQLGELSGLTKLDLKGNKNLGNTSEAKAFPAELGKMKSLRDLSLENCGLRTVPSFIGELESLEVRNLSECSLSSLPKELGELSGLTKLDLKGNNHLGNTPEAEAFPAELGKMKSLRELSLESCGLRAVPAFIGKLKSLEVLDLRGSNDFEVDAALAALLKGCRSLRGMKLPVSASSDSVVLLAKLLTEHAEAKASH